MRFEINGNRVQVFCLKICDSLDKANGTRINGLVNNILLKKNAVCSLKAFQNWGYNNRISMSEEELKTFNEAVS